MEDIFSNLSSSTTMQSMSTNAQVCWNSVKASWLEDANP